ncbi:hypothetical protein PZB75_10995 [Streptomyces sp. AM 4-1-1]|nr:hypothetical protein [Streptomyces sp. AM 4-1-1]WEH33850.1 hypothetical protein PZB75_10995 [Streptomyces sp. AM 4-1-1]
MAGQHSGGTGSGQGGSQQDDSNFGAKHGGGGSGDGDVNRDDSRPTKK